MRSDFSFKTCLRNTLKKAITSYNCQECGASYAKWQGKCSSCQAWNTIVEEIATPKEASPTSLWKAVDPGYQTSKPTQLTEIKEEEKVRIQCKDPEFNRVLGGGIVPGSLILIGGEPGIGKSTLLLQIALSLNNHKILYVSGEESEQQIKMRASRIGGAGEHCFLLKETALHHIFQQVSKLQPSLLIIDSIQTLYTSHVESSMGSVAQVRTCATELMHFAKSTNIPVFLIGHITKEGTLAGPKVLEHMVDTVLQFEGDRNQTYRILRTIKNRFGATSELGIYEMLNSGLRSVENPSEMLLSERSDPLSGIAIGVCLEGNRPLLIEIQALVTTATYGTPQRSATGSDAKRLNMLLAVLEKRAGLRLGNQDVFLNVAGGLKVQDPALDLAVCMAIVSALTDRPIPPNTCFAAEVGLGGEIRGVGRIGQRILEANKLGMNSMFIAQNNMKGLPSSQLKVVIQPVEKINQPIQQLVVEQLKYESL